MNLTQFMNQPAVAPLIHPLILCLLAAFGICLLYAAYTDYKKGVLLPNWKYWLFPGIFALLALISRTICSPVFGSASAADIIISLVVVLMYYATAWKGLLGGADFWGCSLVTIMLCAALGWPAFLLFVFIALIFIPFVCRFCARVKWCYDTAGACTWEAWKKSYFAVKKSYRLLPAVFAGYVGAIIIWLGACFL